ncbi:MAG: LLM class flavin-dependent oxidoreductase, partial [Myxococcota bacterium]
DETIEIMKRLCTGKSVGHKGEFFEFENALMSPAPPAPIPILSGGASPAALRRAARNDGWLGVPMMARDLIATVKGLYEARQEMGKGDQPFDVCCSLIEPLKPDLESELDELGAHNNMVLPWVVTPWGRAPWLRDDEDVSSLDAKKSAMERFANKVIHRN